MSAPNNLPKVLQVSTIASIENMNIKTEVLDPITATNSQVVFQIPKTGILDGGSMVQLGVLADNNLFFPLNTGIHGLIKSCFLKVGGKVLASNDDYAHYTTMTRQFDTPEHRAYVDMVKSGACGDRWAEVESGRIGYRDLVSVVNANPTLTASNVPEFIKPTPDPATTPLFSVPLSTLIPMMKTRTMPLMALKEHVYIEINFNSQSTDAQIGTICCRRNGSAASAVVVPSLTNIKFISDHLYYTDEKMDEVVMKSLSEDGLSVLYEDIITTFADVPPLAGVGAGVLVPQKVERQIAVSGKTVRNILVAEKNTNDNHVVLGNYFSRDLIVPTSYNFRINDQRIYDRDVEAPPRKYNELSQVMGKPLMVPSQIYSYDVDTDKQDQPLQRPNQNSVFIGKVEEFQMPNAAGTDISNDLRATSSYYGYDASTTGFNVLGNGQTIGVKPILVQRTYQRQADNGNIIKGQNDARQMRIFTNVERIYNISKGEITISA